MQNLFTSDRMIVKGSIREYNCPPIPEDATVEVLPENVKTLSLEFIFQVNGKITQYQYDFHIGEVELQGLTLVNWYEWYPVAELFFSMGYNFGTNPFHQESSIIKKWINECNGTKA